MGVFWPIVCLPRVRGGRGGWLQEQSFPTEKGGEGVLGEDELDNAYFKGVAVWCLFFLSQAKKYSTLHFELAFPPTFFFFSLRFLFFKSVQGRLRYKVLFPAGLRPKSLDQKVT